MKISKAVCLVIGGAVVSGIGVMTVFAKDLDKNLNNALQHISSVKFIPTDTSDSMEATVSKAKGNGNRTVSIVTPNFVLTQSGDSQNDIDGTNHVGSTILGGERNKISGGGQRWDAILAGSGNEITNSSYATILGGESNSIINCDYATILGGENNKVEKNGSSSCQYSDVLGGSDNVVKGQHSKVVGNNSSVEGDYSVAMGSGSKVKANKSFLWTDGKHGDETLQSDGVFAVVSDRGMVINTGKAHDFAQLTIGGPLVLEEGTDFACNPDTKGSLKSLRYDNDKICFCSCDGSGWNSLYDRGRCSDQCKSNNKDPKCGSKVYKICPNPLTSDTGYYYSGTCEVGEVVMGKGAYMVDKNSKVYWSCQTEAGNVTGCVAEITSTIGTCSEPAGCQGALPENAELWDSAAALPRDSLSNTYSYSYSATSTNEVCKFKCKEHFTWDGTKCVGDDNTEDCKNLPHEAQWIKSPFNQKYNGGNYYPTGISPTMDSTKDCSFKCKDGYHRDNHYRCIKDAANGTCGEKPANTEWVSSTTYTMMWNGSAYVPANNLTPRYSEDSTVACAFKCSGGYHWNGSACVQKDGVCTRKPDNTVWVKGTFHQTRDGDVRKPASQLEDAEYDPTGAKDCSFKCKENFVYDSVNKKCVLTGGVTPTPTTNTCQGTLPANAELWNSNTPTNNTTNYSYSATTTPSPCKFKCVNGYKWQNNTCVKDDNPTPTTNTCQGTLPANAELWNSNTPTNNTTNYSYSATTTPLPCKFKCVNGYKWQNNACVKDDNPTPGTCNTANAHWGDACCLKSKGDPVDTECYASDRQEGEPRWKHDANYCTENKRCEECTNYGQSCYRSLYVGPTTQIMNGVNYINVGFDKKIRGEGMGLCVKRSNGAGECVACFEKNTTFDVNTVAWDGKKGGCFNVACGTNGKCKYQGLGPGGDHINKKDYYEFNGTPNGDGTWTCTKGSQDYGITTVTCS